MVPSLLPRKKSQLQINILPALKSEDVHGTAPLSEGIVVCITPEGQLLAVPPSRYSSSDRGFDGTLVDSTQRSRPQKGVLAARNWRIPILSN